MKAALSEIQTVARENLGFESLRPGQREAVESVLSGRDTLVVQPTGSGKSAIYQIAGMLIEGSTVVISPLIALQKDQVDSIQNRDIESGAAAAVNSMKRASENDESVQKIEQGRIEYIFLAPEQLHKPETIETLRRAGVSLFVVDEAHCISEWGHDFRPDYLRLGGAIEALGHPRVLAMTATASPEVRREIVERLQMREPNVLVRGFDRPNIYLRVDHFKTEDDKREALIRRVLFAEKPGIVYTGTRKAAEQIMGALADEGVDSLFYHGGLRGKERSEIQERFMSGTADVIVATNAFGMGIDKPDVRFVFHYDVPESLDSYYQEIGRAGRDGLRSEAALFYRGANMGAQSFKAGGSRLDPELAAQIARRVSSADGSAAPAELASEMGISKRKITTALQRLEDVGAVEWVSSEEVRIVPEAQVEQAAVDAAAEQDRHRDAGRERLEEMRAYANSTTCRRELLLRYLGDAYTGPCRFCDNCEELSVPNSVDPAEGTRREVT